MLRLVGDTLTAVLTAASSQARDTTPACPAGMSAAPRAAVLDAAGVSSLTLSGRGVLRVYGRPDLTQIRVQGVACSTHPSYLADLRLTSSRSASDVRLVIGSPDRRAIATVENLAMGVNLLVEVPASIAVNIDYGGGEVDVNRVSRLQITGVHGTVRVQDVPQDVQVRAVSGTVDVSRVTGGVMVQGAAGRWVGVSARDVGGTLVVSAARGSVTADHIGADLVVTGIDRRVVRYQRVAGRVDIRAAPDR